MAGPLGDIRVLEIANVIAGPYTGMLLADMGAEVIKIEPPGKGDLFRSASGTGLYSPQFITYNRSKRSVTLNLRDPDGLGLLKRLVEGADVLLENLRPGVAQRLGFNYEVLRPINSRLVYCSLTGFGDSGPYVANPAYDGVIQGISGMMSQLTAPNDPRPVGPAFADHIAGLFACNAILGALIERQQSGEGQYVSVPMLSASLSFLNSSATRYFLLGEVDESTTNQRLAQIYAFTCADEKALMIHLSTPPKYWLGLLDAVGRPELAEDPRFANVSGRRAHYDELQATLRERFVRRPRDEWLATLEAHGVPAGPLNTILEAVRDPQVRHLGLEVEMDWPESVEPSGRLQGIAYPARYSRTPLLPPATPPVLGAATVAVLSELGVTPAEMDTLRERGAI